MEQETKNIEPRYAKVYVSPHSLFSVLDKSEVLVFLRMMCMIDKDNVIKLDKDIRKEMTESCGFRSLGTVSAALTTLKRVKAIVSVSRGVYMFNPLFAVDGSISVRSVNRLIKKFNTLVNDTLL